MKFHLQACPLRTAGEETGTKCLITLNFVCMCNKYITVALFSCSMDKLSVAQKISDSSDINIRIKSYENNSLLEKVTKLLAIYTIPFPFPPCY